MEAAPQERESNNVESLGKWRELREAGPQEAEAVLAKLELPQHEESISTHEDLTDLYHIVNEVDALERAHNEQMEHARLMEDVTERAVTVQALNQQRYKLRHLGYLREVAATRIFQLELKGQRVAA